MMFVHTDTKSPTSPLRALSVLVFLLLLIHLCTGQSLIGSSQPIVATHGDNVTLPCRLDPAEDVTDLTVEWTRPDLDPRFVHVRRSGQELVSKKHPWFRERTSLFINELKHGNISLKLSRVKLSDQGTYTCFIPGKEKLSSVQLFVASDAVSSPVITLEGVDKTTGGVVLHCSSSGWHPEPEVLWLDGEGNLLSAGPTETVRGPDDLYTVSSRVTVEKRHSNSFTCRVQQNKTNQTTETQIHVPDDFFKVQSSSSSVIIGLAVSLAVCIVVILSLVFCLWKKRQDKTRQKDSTRNKTEGGGEEMTPMRETVDGNTNHPQSGGRGAAASRSSFPPWRIISTQKLQEQQRRTQSLEEELQRRTQILEQELWSKKEEVEGKQKEIQQLQDQNHQQQTELQRLNQELENKNKQLESQLSEEKKNRMEAERKMKEELQKTKTEMEKKLQDEQRRRMEAEKQLNSELKKERERREREVKSLEDQLQSKTKQVKDRGAEIQIQDQNRDLQRLNQELKDKNKQLERNQTAANAQLQQERERRVNAEREVERLKDQTKQSAETQSSTTGSIIVDQIDPQGKSVRLRNQSDKDQQLDGWRMDVKVDDRKPIVYTFRSFTLGAGQTVTIWASDSGVKHSYPTDLVWSGQKSLGHGNQTVVTVFSSSGQEVTTKTFTAKHGS